MQKENDVYMKCLVIGSAEEMELHYSISDGEKSVLGKVENASNIRVSFLGVVVKSVVWSLSQGRDLKGAVVEYDEGIERLELKLFVNPEDYNDVWRMLQNAYKEFQYYIEFESPRFQDNFQTDVGKILQSKEKEPRFTSPTAKQFLGGEPIFCERASITLKKHVVPQLTIWQRLFPEA